MMQSHHPKKDLKAILNFTRKTSTTHDYVTERVVQIPLKKPGHITHKEFSFHLSLCRPSETLWFGPDNGTTVLAYLLYSMMSSKPTDFVGSEEQKSTHRGPSHRVQLQFYANWTF